MIVCAADLHIRPDKPVSRVESLEEWIEVQFSKLTFLLDYCQQHSAPLLIAGDICHKATGWPSWLFSRLITLFSKYDVPFYAIPGQHDLPHHQIDRLGESNLGVLFASGTLCPDHYILFDPFPWPGIVKGGVASIAVTHQMVIQNTKEELWPGQSKETGVNTAEGLLRKYPNYKLIVSGDNHQPFAYHFRGRWLVNPGSMTRQKIGDNYAPGFFVYHEGGETWEAKVERVTFPHKENVLLGVTSQQFETIYGGSPEKVEEFLSLLQEGEDLYFRDALEEYFAQKKTRIEVRERILGK